MVEKTPKWPEGAEIVHFTELTPEQVLQQFQKYDYVPFFRVFKKVFEQLASSSRTPLRAYKPGENLSLLILQLKRRGENPLVDKRSGLVFIVDHHRLPCAALYGLYSESTVKSFDEFFNKEASTFADAYIREGHGYFWTSMGENRPVVGEKYSPTKYDEEAWQMLT